MSRFTSPRRRAVSARNVARSSRRARAAVEAMEVRVMLSTYVVNTFVDQTDAPSSTTLSLRDALFRAAVHAGPDTVNIPAGDYTLTQGYLAIDDSQGVTLQGVGGQATIDGQSKTSIIIFLTTRDTVATFRNLNITGASAHLSASDSAICNYGMLTIVNSSISGNAGPGLLSLGVGATLIGDTISNNAFGIGSNAPLSIVNSTISGNRLDGIQTFSNFSIFDSTFTNNQAFGIDNEAGQGTIGNSILTGSGIGQEVNMPIVSDGGNLVGVVGSSTGWIASDKTGTAAHPLDPVLAPLGNYGGPTPTSVPVAGSPALNGGVASAIPAGTSTDQRGLPRVVGVVDSGAVEIQGAPKNKITPAAAQQFVGKGVVSIGSFTATGLAGPFTAEIQWGDGTPDTSITMSSAGIIPAQFHAFGGAGVFHAAVAITDRTGDLSNSATFNLTDVAAPLTSIVVNTTKDQTDPATSTTVSLRDAIARADREKGPVAITFNPTVFAAQQTITFTGPGAELMIGGNPFGVISITGPAAGVTLDIAKAGNLIVQTGAIVAIHHATVIGDAANGNGIINNGSLTIDHSTVSTLLSGIYNTGTLALAQSLITEGGFSSAAVKNLGVATLTDCTITGNANAAFENSGSAVIADCTITGNTEWGVTSVAGATVTLSNTIVANNSTQDPADAGDVAGVIKSLGHNLIGKKDFGTGYVSSDRTGTIAHPLGPKLSPLGNYGGPTQTQFPMPGSPALGAGSVALIPAGLTIDQRGFSRVVGGKVDIGAFQTQSRTIITFAPPALQHEVAGVAANVALGSFTDPGGSGPFIVTVNWADGTAATSFTVNSAGSLGTRAQTFIKTGTIANSIVVVDSAGDLKTGTFTVASAPAALKTIVVNTIKDVTDAASSATVSLRDAINRANASFGPVNITFSPTVFAKAQTIALASAIPALQGNPFGQISIVGPSAGVTIKSHTVFIDSGHGEEIPTGNTFTISAGVAASFSNVTFEQLGFENDGGFLSLVNCTIADNLVVGNGAGIANFGTVTLLGCTITDNRARIDAGPGGSSGGNGGGIENNGTLTIINSTFARNTADSFGGGIDNQGAASIFDSTIANNQAGFGGEIVNENPAPGFTPTVALSNTIVVGDTTVGSFDIAGRVISHGHNLVGEADATSGLVSTDLRGTVAHPLDAHLSALGNNGGPTQTMIPLPGSPALNAGAVFLIPAGITTDQRGLARTVGGFVDIGSVEIQRNTPFSGSPPPFTTIEAENFDKGGQGTGYYNPGNVNRGGLYRPTEGVGIGAIPAASGGGFFVGYTQTGEFLNYTVSVAATGTYTLNFRVASTPAGGTFHLSVDGVNVTGSLSVPNTGNFNTYKLVSKTGVHLTAGVHLLQLMIDSVGTYGAAGNFDWIQAVKTA